MTEPVHLASFDVDQSGPSTIYRCSVSGLGEPRDLTYSVISSTGHSRPALSSNWALMAMLLPAMRAGKNMVIEGGISPLLLHFSRSDVQSLLLNFEPDLQRIQIDADVLADAFELTGTPRIGTGFSAGVDSFAALLSFRSTGLAEHMNVTDLFTFFVGGFGEDATKGQTRLFNSAVQRTSNHARELGLHSHSVSSNIMTFYSGIPGMDFVRTHTLRNASAASLFEREIDLYLYASAYDYSEINLSDRYAIANVDPILLPLLSTQALRFVSSNAGMGRIDKTAMISDEPVAKRLLDVCVMNAPKRIGLVGHGRNCSRCWKCNRTMITLDALGALQNFSEVFDLPYYYANRDEIVADIQKRGTKGSTLDRSAAKLFINSRDQSAIGTVSPPAVRSSLP